MSQAYESLAAELHDAFQDSHGPSPELSLMQDFLACHPGRALEIGCGSGRLLLPLCEAGMEVEGLELSTSMLQMARERAQDLGLEPRLHQGDMDHWQPESRYACLLTPSFTLQLASDPATTLRHWASWLEPGGGLYMSVFMPYGELTGELPEGEWYEDHRTTLPCGEMALLEARHRLDSANSRILREHRYTVSGRSRREHRCQQAIRWAEPQQWQEWLQEAGFTVNSRYLDWDAAWNMANPGPDDFDGILTFEATLRAHR
ncbi:MAG: class I SAM-dependent methyltransferase [Akkermansiaceae bacterium]|nr:class I SAM-dependent methyltransferase [Akkermansiaceae bacterium]